MALQIQGTLFPDDGEGPFEAFDPLGQRRVRVLEAYDDRVGRQVGEGLGGHFLQGAGLTRPAAVREREIVRLSFVLSRDRVVGKSLDKTERGEQHEEDLDIDPEGGSAQPAAAAMTGLLMTRETSQKRMRLSTRPEPIIFQR